MRRRFFIVLSLLVAILAMILLWPMATDDFEINWDKAASANKKAYLDSIKRSDSIGNLPNILVILVDDLGVYDISFNGNTKVSTPNIDGIARAGVTFDRAYTASPVCSPARASILTGRYPQRFGFEFQMHDRYASNRLEYLGFKYLVKSQPWKPQHMEKVPRKKDIDRQGLPPSEITIPEMLQARGYSTALIGKWHLGWHQDNTPCNFGFDYQYGFFDSHTLYTPEGTAGITDQKIKEDFTDKYIWKDGRKGPKAIYRNCQPIVEEEHLTEAITRESMAFIREYSSQPFFLLAAYNAPHTPLQAPDEYVAMFSHEPDPVKRVYYAMIKQLDDNIGKLLNELSELGLQENTLIIFLSDNGGATYTLTTDNGPLRGGKITDFEGGLRIPFFMKWPEKIIPGNHYALPVISMDVFATIASVVNFPLPSDRQIDGMNLLDFIEDSTAIPHPYLFWQRGHSKAIATPDWKVVWNEEFRDTLAYRLRDDPNEKDDLYFDKSYGLRVTGYGPWNMDSTLIEPKSPLSELIRIHLEWSSGLPEPLWPAIVHFKEEVDGRWFYFDN